jgi:hypothetical protein
VQVRSGEGSKARRVAVQRGELTELVVGMSYPHFVMVAQRAVSFSNVAHGASMWFRCSASDLPIDDLMDAASETAIVSPPQLSLPEVTVLRERSPVFCFWPAFRRTLMFPKETDSAWPATVEWIRLRFRQPAPIWSRSEDWPVHVLFRTFANQASVVVPELERFDSLVEPVLGWRLIADLRARVRLVGFSCKGRGTDTTEDSVPMGNCTCPSKCA